MQYVAEELNATAQVIEMVGDAINHGVLVAKLREWAERVEALEAQIDELAGGPTSS